MSAEGLTDTIIIHDNIPDEIIKIKEQPGKDILIFGSPSISQLLIQANLVDNYWVFINPVLFGQGIPLFGGLTNKIKLKLTDTKQFLNGEMALNYIVDKQH